MGIQIEGFGAGNVVAVTSEGHMVVDAVTLQDLGEHSETNGQAFSFSNATYNYTAADTILLVKNTSQTLNLFVTKIVVVGDSATEVIIHRPVSEVTPTGTAVTPRNLGSAATTAPATAIGDETNNSQGDILLATRIAANTPFTWDTGSSVIVTTNKSIGVDFVSVGAAANVTILGYFK